MKALTLAFSALSLVYTSTGASSVMTTPVLSDIKLLEKAGIPMIARDEATGVAYAELTPKQEKQVAEQAHEWRRCGGYEALPKRPEKAGIIELFAGLRAQDARNSAFERNKAQQPKVERNTRVAAALNEVKEEKLSEWVNWFSSFPTRLHSSATGNDAINALKTRLEESAKQATFPVQVSLIDHRSTRQKSVRVHIEGAKRPSEIVVIGGHIDSINHEEGTRAPAPGSDDNASGSSNLLEAYRILLSQPQPERSIEIFWYAGEEAGLLGSAEIAKSYKSAHKDVIGALQLDMTLFPGSGEFVLGSMTDFTSAWLRAYLVELNKTYTGAKIVDDKCGYGCSDHASWYRQGFPSVMPFESTFDDMNHNLHTRRDVVDGKSNFAHSAMFAKLALAFAMDLGNSTARAP